MESIFKAARPGELVPVLLGISKEATQTAHRLYREYGVVSHVFCDRIPLAMRVSFCMKFHPFEHASGDRLMVSALLDFTTQLGNSDVILYLVPCTEAYAGMVFRNRDELERRYVIANRPEMDRIWFGGEEGEKV